MKLANLKIGQKVWTKVSGIFVEVEITGLVTGFANRTKLQIKRTDNGRSQGARSPQALHRYACGFCPDAAGMCGWCGRVLTALVACLALMSAGCFSWIQPIAGAPSTRLEVVGPAACVQQCLDEVPDTDLATWRHAARACFQVCQGD